MAVCEIHLGAENALHRMTSVTVIVPENLPGPWPVLYLLHGLSDDHTTWTRRTSIERYVEGLPLMVVMPNVERSWYTDSATIPSDAFETFVTCDLVRFVENTFSVKRSREGRAICGLSMGGYGAFRLSMKHPELFCAAVSFSGALAFGCLDEGDHLWKTEMLAIFGEDPRNGPEDIPTIIQSTNKNLLPALWIDCGSEDFLIESNRKVHALLTSLGVEHEYMERPGVHEWVYWDTGIQLALPFIKRNLGIGGFGD